MQAEPPYVALHASGELGRRVEASLELLRHPCLVCPRHCKIDRQNDGKGLCGIGRLAVVASCFAHFGEEDCLRGTRGSGTVFLSGCNLRCVFCQNFDISWEVTGATVTPRELAALMLELQSRGCHNINWVTPEHVVPQLLESMPYAVEAGLRLPIVYNTSAYDSEESLALLDGVVSIYMPDFKLWSPEAARRYVGRADYPEVARRSLLEMHRQVGDLELDRDGLAVRGLLVRHLVMPGMLEETKAILRFLATEIGPGTFVNLMAQYHPAGRVRNGRYPEIGRRIWREEFEAALALADEAGLRRLDPRSRGEGLLQLSGHPGS